jgi:hypothetical protein
MRDSEWARLKVQALLRRCAIAVARDAEGVAARVRSWLR